MPTSTADPTTAILTPADPGWDDARQAWNLAVDQRPAAIAVPRSADAAAAAVGFARRRGLRVAAQGTGHGAAPLGPLAGTVLIKTQAMRRVSDRPGRPDRPRRGRGPSGAMLSRRPPGTAWRRWRAPHPTSAWPATRSAAG